MPELVADFAERSHRPGSVAMCVFELGVRDMQNEASLPNDVNLDD
jgi:hypothetical protein